MSDPGSIYPRPGEPLDVSELAAFQASQQLGNHPEVGGQPPVPELPGTPKRRGVLVLGILVAVLTATAGTFTTLWFVERSDHQSVIEQLDTNERDLISTSDELKTARSRQADVASQLADVQKNLTETQDKLEEAQKVTGNTDAERKCAETGRRLAELALSGAETEAQKAFVDLASACS
jgi:septal ring factor EnvC (AmiA/AmiB activator)